MNRNNEMIAMTMNALLLCMVRYSFVRLTKREGGHLRYCSMKALNNRATAVSWWSESYLFNECRYFIEIDSASD
ncbi:MAG: hypothetical protein LLG97_14710 [Deltaproteobacteria bacterium]|nr:hypothetical protein [Deltaproteobacteria bacterium]